MTDIKLGILLGSARKRSLSTAVARGGLTLLPKGATAVILPHPATLPHYDQDLMDAGLPQPVAQLRDAAAACDAFVIVTPEYNWSFPGTLKNAIDWLSRLSPNPLDDRPVCLWTVSPGMLGGARAHEGLRHVLHSQGMRIMAKPEVQINGAAAKVDVEAGRITDDATQGFLKSQLAKFVEFAARR